MQRPWGSACLVREEHRGAVRLEWNERRQGIARAEVRVREARPCGTPNAVSKTLTFTLKIMRRHQEDAKQRNDVI